MTVAVFWQNDTLIFLSPENRVFSGKGKGSTKNEVGMMLLIDR